MIVCAAVFMCVRRQGAICLCLKFAAAIRSQETARRSAFCRLVGFAKILL
jgi:hypothetical protein